MEIEKAKIIFDQLYKEINGMDISLSARKKLGLDDKSLVYGEILFDDFCKLLFKSGLKKMISFTI
ncbi:MAG: hypothetical protein ACPLZH_03265 [Minisyncoccales bacterium]